MVDADGGTVSLCWVNESDFSDAGAVSAFKSGGTLQIRDATITDGGQNAAILMEDLANTTPEILTAGPGGAGTITQLSGCVDAGLSYAVEARQIAFGAKGGGTYVLLTGKTAPAGTAKVKSCLFETGGAAQSFFTSTAGDFDLGSLVINASNSELYVGGNDASAYLGEPTFLASGLLPALPVSASINLVDGYGTSMGVIDARDGFLSYSYFNTVWHVHEGPLNGDNPDGGTNLYTQQSESSQFGGNFGTGYTHGRQLAIASDGHVWFATTSGLYRW
jgi:hypothetical protein